ncbi:MAG: prolipoprotein diacylglyceryl transferase [Candidatus Cyclobacteriaceae bacterium M2_1C_046]
MEPILFEIPLPDVGFLPDYFTVYSYGFFIALGALLGITYTTLQGKKHFGLSFDDINTLFILLIVAAFVGGKFFLIFEDPARYGRDPMALLSGSGFVFYGSLLFCIPVMLIYFKKKNLPTLHMLDIMAVTTVIVHFFGRIGCFMSGCCHGIQWEGPIAVVFSDPMCAAPLNTPLHPTQLYSATMLGLIFLFLIYKKQHKTFHGQLFLLYLMIYPIGRSIIEVFRGDEARGFVIENYISHAQFVSLIIFFIAFYFYQKLSRRKPSLSV